MRQVQVIVLGWVLAFAALLSLPVAVGTTRRHLGRWVPGSHVLIVDGWHSCVAPSEDFCVPLWEYPAFVPGWYARALGFSH